MKRKRIIALLSVFILGILINDVYSSSSEIKQRMISRLPQIQALKDKGIVGENNKGFLEFIGGQKEGADVVQAENKDREEVYAAIAKQQGTTVEVVGKHRAVQITQSARAGEWLQDGSGKWYKKGQ
jgi:uncharacterized protein YdbL (DUF1318 family)